MRVNRNHIILWLILLLLGNIGLAQVQTLRFKHFTTASGLPNNHTSDIIQDNKGFIWFGTSEGLSRFDGHRIRTYNDVTSNLEGKRVFRIHQDNDGAIWVSTNRGLSRFDSTTESFKNYVIDSVRRRRGRRNSRINAICEDRFNTLWIGMRKGVAKIDKTTGRLIKKWSDLPQKKVLDQSLINHMFKDSKGRLWVSTSENGVFLLTHADSGDLTKITQFKQDNDRPNTIKRNNVLQVTEDGVGTIWVVTDRALYKIVDESVTSDAFEFQQIQTPYAGATEYFDLLYSAVPDKDNGLWVGYLNGIYYLAPGASRLQPIEIITDDPVLRHNYPMTTKFVDKSGVLWAISYNGIYAHDLNRKKFKIYRTEDYTVKSRQQNMTWSILKEDNGQIWLGTSYGLVKLIWNEETKKYEYHPIPNQYEIDTERINKPVHEIIEFGNDHLIVATSLGLYKLDKRTLAYTKIPIKLSNAQDMLSRGFNRVNALAWGSNDILWIGTRHGLIKYDTRQGSMRGYTLPGGVNSRANNRINTLKVDDKQRVWIGTMERLNLFYPEEERFEYIQLPNRKEHASIWSIHIDEDGSIWYATYGSGIYHIKPNGIDFSLEAGFTHEEYHAKEGLKNEYIYSILTDENNNLWMSSNMGLTKFDRKLKRFENFIDQDGLQGNEFNSGAYFKAKDGELFFGGTSGVNSFYPNSIKKNEQLPDIVITDIFMGDERYDSTADNSKDNPAEVLFDNVPIRFEFSALSFNNVARNQYKVKLENYDKEWIDLSNQSSIIYSKLAPKTYEFKVLGANSDGVWNDKPAIFTFTVVPLFYQTWWFFALIGLFLLSIFFFVFYTRLRQVELKAKRDYFKDQDQQKSMMLKEIHHRVKNNLQVVNSLLKLQSRQVEDTEVVDMFNEARNRILSMAMLHERMYGTNDLQHVDILEHFKSLINDLIKSYGMRKMVDVEISVEDVEMGISTLTPLGLMINEIVSNSLKHAFVNRNNGTIKVHISPINDGKYQMIIGDDGIGRDMNCDEKGLGTRLINTFARQLKGSIARLDEEGTVFRVVFERVE